MKRKSSDLNERRKISELASSDPKRGGFEGEEAKHEILKFPKFFFGVFNRSRVLELASVFLDLDKNRHFFEILRSTVDVVKIARKIGEIDRENRDHESAR